MPNGKYILDEYEFEKTIKSLSDRDLLETVARQNYDTAIKCLEYERRIGNLESGAKKVSSVFGGIAGVIAAIVASIINYFVTKG